MNHRQNRAVFPTRHREHRSVLSVVFYVVSRIPQNRIPLKSCKKQKKTPEIRRFQVLFWSCWADLNRRPHPYQKALSLFMVYSFMLGNIPESLVLQGVRDFFFPIGVIV